MEVSKTSIGKDGIECFLAIYEEHFDEDGLWHGAKAVEVRNYHSLQQYEIYSFLWWRGVPTNFKLIKRVKGEIVTEQEVPRLIEETVGTLRNCSDGNHGR